ncbi:hypothetical protein DV515_00019830 [Chloebia gouldiae]|uniref:Uncharacterized protein n=1 Tax=Chloebia gouldiae TaxID=44316 RepID=A0A3L8Q3M4_CHLGU|nr:hypothetical protein DV515_00019830 [Chloebia gouldiae]
MARGEVSVAGHGQGSAVSGQWAQQDQWSVGSVVSGVRGQRGQRSAGSVVSGVRGQRSAVTHRTLSMAEAV